ncbi:MAG TPA: hypothetical protein PLL78_09470 [Fimbriimonadaceae bacterium]|nr:hypothetical protein [Fimbriimonadaceae bacterium]HRJ96903.1 hypothetical protein [Fimbriimonadaceae bacterium]
MSEHESMVRIFDSFEQADRADREEYAAMTPEQRLDILLQLVLEYYGPPPRLQRVLTVAQFPPG